MPGTFSHRHHTLWCLPFQDIISEEVSKDRSLALTGMPTARVSACGNNHLLRSFPFRQTASPFTPQDGGNYEHVPGVSGDLGGELQLPCRMHV